MANVLVVDDEARWSELICKIAKHKGHEVAVARSGSEAIQMIRKSNAFDIVITDTQMSGGDGIDLLTFIYEKYGEASRSRTYIHSSSTTYWSEGGSQIDLKTEIPERFPGTIFKRKSTNTFDDVEEFLRR
jgi:CheY-like chemotaxis protein